MLIAGNWKMNLNYLDIMNFEDIVSGFKLDSRVEMAVFPQLPLLYSAKKNLSRYEPDVLQQR